MRQELHEDVAAVVIGMAVVPLALAVTWAARPADEPGSRERHPKGWSTPLAATPGTWTSQPLAASIRSWAAPGWGARSMPPAPSWPPANRWARRPARWRPPHPAWVDDLLVLWP